MKRFLFCAAAAIVALASCSKTEVVNTSAPQEIGFKAVTGAITKTTDFETRTDNSLGVFANTNGTNDVYFGNTEFGKNGTNWTAGKYWPIQGSLDFTVYAPHVNNAGYNKDTRVLTIPVEDNTTAQIDWLYGKERYLNKTKTNAPITTILNHGLSKITVTIQADAANVYTVSSIKLNNTDQAGSLIVTYKADGTFDNINPTPADPAVKGDLEFANTDSETIVTANTTVPQKSLYVFPSAQTSFTVSYSLAGSVGTHTGTVNLSNNWVSGMHYTYNLKLTATQIEFSEPTISAWGDGGTTTPVVM